MKLNPRNRSAQRTGFIRACLSHPELQHRDACTWPILEVKLNGVLFGSGESTQFGQSLTAYIDGKRVSYSKSPGSVDRPSVESILAAAGISGTPIQFYAHHGSAAYAVKPPGI